MSKNKLQKVLKFIADSAIRSLAVFLILGASVGAYAYMSGGVNWPDNAPSSVTGVVGMFVGTTADVDPTKVFNGSQGGYNAANEKCNTAFVGSHICTAAEIINTYNNNESIVNNSTGRAWINNGPPGFLDTPANDCVGWTKQSNDKYGYSWIFELGAFKNHASLDTCNNPSPFACCK